VHRGRETRCFPTGTGRGTLTLHHAKQLKKLFLFNFIQNSTGKRREPKPQLHENRHILPTGSTHFSSTSGSATFGGNLDK
jgi:hypothetical protein